MRSLAVLVSIFLPCISYAQSGQTINLFATVGGPPVSQQLQVPGSGDHFDIAFLPQDWLQLSATTGTAPATIIVTGDPTNLAPGQYLGEIAAFYQNGPPVATLVVLNVSGITQMSISPASGTGTSQQFALTVTDLAGWQNNVVDILINNALDGRQACYIAFVPSGPGSGSLYLVNDAGNAGGPFATAALPGSGTIANSQCSVNAGLSSATISGFTLTLSLAVTFRDAFAGNKLIYAAARDAQSNSGWQTLGLWKVPGGTPAPISVGGAQNFSFTFTDTNGASDIAVANVLINSTLNGVGACYVAIVPGRVLLVDVAGDAAGPYQSLTLPGSGTIANQQCSISAQGSSISANGNTLTVTLAITFGPGFGGTRVVYAAARSALQNTGWQPVSLVQ